MNRKPFKQRQGWPVGSDQATEIARLEVLVADQARQIEHLAGVNDKLEDELASARQLLSLVPSPDLFIDWVNGYTAQLETVEALIGQMHAWGLARPGKRP